MKATTLSVLVASLVFVAACSGDATSDQTSTTMAQGTTTVPPETTPTTTTAPPETTTTTVQAPVVPGPDETVLVYGGEVNSKFAQTESSDSDGVTVLTIEYVDTIEMSDPRASGTAEWTATLYSPPGDDLGGTWTSEGATLTNDGGTWVDYRLGTYILARNMPSALTTNPGVKTGEVHYIGQGGYEGLRMDLYTSSDGYIGTIGPVEDGDTDASGSLEGVAATADTQMVHGAWTGTTAKQTGSTFVDGVEVVTIEYSEVLEMSDTRASATMEYTATLSAIEFGVGGTWLVEEVVLANEAGQWVGNVMGGYVYTDNMPDALTTGDAVIIGEWHLVGTGDYDGLRLDFYSSSDGVVGTINPIN